MLHRIKNSLWWRADLPLAIALLGITATFGLFGGLIGGIIGVVVGVLVALAMIQLLDLIP